MASAAPSSRAARVGWFEALPRSLRSPVDICRDGPRFRQGCAWPSRRFVGFGPSRPLRDADRDSLWSQRSPDQARVPVGSRPAAQAHPGRAGRCGRAFGGGGSNAVRPSGNAKSELWHAARAARRETGRGSPARPSKGWATHRCRTRRLDHLRFKESLSTGGHLDLCM
jgi:hypothetical protein